MYLESRGERPPCHCPKMSAMPSAPISPWCGRGSTNRDSMSRRCSSACGRRTARSHNHLLGVIRCFFDWLVVQERIAHSPVRIGPRRTGPRPMPFLFDCVLAKRFLDIARAFPDRPRGPSRGPTYHLIFAMMYTLGLRVGEVSRLQFHDVDLDRCVLSIRQTKFAKDRLVPFGPRLRAKLAEYIAEVARRAGRRHPQAPLFSFRCARPIYPCTRSHTFHYVVRGHPAFSPPPGVSAPKLHCLRHPRRRPVAALGVRRRHVEAELQLLHPGLALRFAPGCRAPSRPVSPIRRSGEPHRPHALADQSALAGSDRRAGRTHCRRTPPRRQPRRASRRPFRRIVRLPFPPTPVGQPRLPLSTTYRAHRDAGSWSPACQERGRRRGSESARCRLNVRTGEAHAHLRERPGLPFRYTGAAWGAFSNLQPLAVPIAAGPWLFSSSESLYQAAKFAARPDIQQRVRVGGRRVTP